MKRDRNFAKTTRMGSVVSLMLILVLSLGTGFAQRKAIFENLGLARDSKDLGYAEGEILVRFKNGVTISKINSFHKQMNVYLLKKISFPSKLTIYHLKLPTGLTAKEAIEKYEAEPIVEYAAPNHKVQALATIPNDEYFQDLWGLHNTSQTGGIEDADIDAPEAWDYYSGSGAVVIADIDTGIQVDHPDLQNNIWINPGEIAGNGIDDDGNGYIDDIYGWDFVNEDNTVYDGIEAHGTHTAGTIGAIGNNSIGVTGVNWQVKIMALKFLEYGGGVISDAIEAFAYAANKGVKVTSNSWSRWGAPNPAMQDAIEACGALSVFAAGNSGADNDAGYPDSTNYPSSYPSENIIAVAASDHTDELASFSNYGATTVDLGAPGVDILSTVPTDQCSPPYALGSGTSMATPHVAGMAGLLMDKFPGITISELKSKILEYVDFKPNWLGLMVTSGRLNVWNTIIENHPPVIDQASVDITIGEPPLEVQFTGSAHDLFAGSIVDYVWNFGDGTNSELRNPTHTYSNEGKYAATLTVTDDEGATCSQKIPIWVTNPANVLFIDDDAGDSYESYFIDALNANGLSYKIWDVYVDGAPPSQLAQTIGLFDMMIWNTGYDWSNTLTGADQEKLAGYLDAGGRLFLSSQDLIWDIGVNDFVQNYLYVIGADEEVGTTSVQGVAGDPITDGLSITLDYPFTDYSDTIYPDGAASGIFVNDGDGFCALRYGGTYRVVFFAFPFEAIPLTGSSPSATVMERIYNWLTGGPPTGDIKINNDAPYTNSREVTLTLSATPDATEMCFSNDNSNWSDWENYATSKSWTLTPGDGEKRVYVKFKGPGGVSDPPPSGTIILDTTASETTLTDYPSKTVTGNTLKVDVTFSWEGSDDITLPENLVYQYKLEGHPDYENWPAGWTSETTKTYTFPSGNYTFKVRAKDEAGNYPDENNNATAKYSFTVSLPIIAYPNPCYSNQGQVVTMVNIPLNSKVYIYTISGELVRILDDATEITIEGDSAIATWDLRNDAGGIVARGIYIYLASNATDKKTGKIAIIK